MNKPGGALRLVIDGLEGDFARCEWGEAMLDLPLAWLEGLREGGLREGDVLEVRHSAPGRLEFVLDPLEREQRRSRVQAKLEAMRLDIEGDISV